jgi:hypothetical protein
VLTADSDNHATAQRIEILRGAQLTAKRALARRLASG